MSLLDYVQDDDGIPDTDSDKLHAGPSNWWYVAHVPFGFASGPLCHAIWEDRNGSEAEKHLAHGIMLNVGMLLAAGVTLMFSFA